MVTKNDILRPLDFEGAWPVDSRLQSRWSTKGFTAPAPGNPDVEHTGRNDDLYALGAVIYLLLTGQVPDQATRAPIEKLRSRVPRDVLRIVGKLLDDDPMERPRASDVRVKLMGALEKLGANNKEFSCSTRRTYAGGPLDAKFSRRSKS